MLYKCAIKVYIIWSFSGIDWIWDELESGLFAPRRAQQGRCLLVSHIGLCRHLQQWCHDFKQSKYISVTRTNISLTKLWNPKIWNTVLRFGRFGKFLFLYLKVQEIHPWIRQIFITFLDLFMTFYYYFQIQWQKRNPSPSTLYTGYIPWTQYCEKHFAYFTCIWKVVIEHTENCVCYIFCHLMWKGCFRKHIFIISYSMENWLFYHIHNANKMAGICLMWVNMKFEDLLYSAAELTWNTHNYIMFTFYKIHNTGIVTFNSTLFAHRLSYRQWSFKCNKSACRIILDSWRSHGCTCIIPRRHFEQVNLW